MSAISRKSCLGWKCSEEKISVPLLRHCFAVYVFVSSSYPTSISESMWCYLPLGLHAVKSAQVILMLRNLGNKFVYSYLVLTWEIKSVKRHLQICSQIRSGWVKEFIPTGDWYSICIFMAALTNALWKHYSFWYTCGCLWTFFSLRESTCPLCVNKPWSFPLINVKSKSVCKIVLS